MGVPEDVYFTRDTAQAQLVALLSGRVAEERLLGGTCTQGASSDLQSASVLASDMVNRYGFTPLGLSVRSRDTTTSQRAVDTLLADAHMRATSLLNEHAGLLETVAQSLLEYQRLDRDELRALYTASIHYVRSPIETDTLRQETGVFKESALVSSAARRHQERRAVVVKRSKTGIARRLVRRLSFRRRRLRAL